MPTLANIQGASLVPDLRGTISGVAQAFGQAQERKTKKETALTKQIDTEDALDVLETGTAKEKESALNRLAILQGPAVANSIRATLASGNAVKIAALKLKNEKGLKDTLLIQSFKDPVKRAQAIKSLAAEPGRTPQEIQEMARLMNLPPDQQEIELRKDQIAFTDVKILQEQQFKKQEAATKRAADVEAKAIEADAKLAVPLTDLGKAKRDLNSKLITQEDFDKIKNAPPEFQSTVGKLVGDLKSAQTVFGKDSPQAQAVQDALDSEAKGEGPKLTDVAGMRKEFTKESGDFIKLQGAIKKINNAPTTGPGDIALIFNYMKILDPQSTVREGEFATAEQAGGVLESVLNTYNRLVTGGRLTPKVRGQFRSAASDLFATQLDTQVQSENIFRKLATDSGIQPNQVVLDFVDPALRNKEAGKTLTGVGEAPTPPSGFVVNQ